MLKLASWNVNSLKIRLEQVIAWLEETGVDVLALQETKLIDTNFPLEAFTSRNFHVVYTGQKTYNGVAVISRSPITECLTDVSGYDDPQRRILAVTIGDVRLINLYVPNGSTPGSEKYAYKMLWLEKVTAFIQQQLMQYPKLAIVGDFNIAPEDRDVHDPVEWEGCILVSPPERQAFQEMLSLGFVDSFRLFPQEDKLFSWWDYRAAGFRRGRGLRIDHVLLSKALANYCVSSNIDKNPRKSERPSDHAPVWVALELG